MIQLTAAMVGMLGGPALQVLMVLAIEREPRALSFIQDMTNLSDKTVHQAARKLLTLGMVTQSGRFAYQIAAGAGQLPLGAVLIEESYPQVSAEAVDNSVDNFEIPAESAENLELGRKFSDLALHESMNESMTQINDEDDSFIDGDAARKISELPADAERPTQEALQALGFYQPGIGQMLAIPGLTMREVRYHAENAPSLGYALARLKKRQAVPENWGRDGPSARREYISGQFAEFVQH